MVQSSIHRLICKNTCLFSSRSTLTIWNVWDDKRKGYFHRDAIIHQAQAQSTLIMILLTWQQIAQFPWMKTNKAIHLRMLGQVPQTLLSAMAATQKCRSINVFREEGKGFDKDIRSRFSPLVRDGNRVVGSSPEFTGHNGLHFHGIWGEKKF